MSDSKNESEPIWKWSFWQIDLFSIVVIAIMILVIIELAVSGKLIW